MAAGVSPAQPAAPRHPAKSFLRDAVSWGARLGRESVAASRALHLEDLVLRVAGSAFCGRAPLRPRHVQ
jgi:hypothetical protein